MGGGSRGGTFGGTFPLKYPHKALEKFSGEKVFNFRGPRGGGLGERHPSDPPPGRSELKKTLGRNSSSLESHPSMTMTSNSQDFKEGGNP